MAVTLIWQFGITNLKVSQLFYSQLLVSVWQIRSQDPLPHGMFNKLNNHLHTCTYE